MTGTDIQALEFELGSETDCVDVECVAEIADMDELTPVPNAPDHVEGVTDLRGRTTSIVTPKAVLGIDDGGDRRRIVVFDPERAEAGGVGWVVDEVDRVERIDPAEASDPPDCDEAIGGMVRKNGDLIIWISPGSVNTEMSIDQFQQKGSAGHTHRPDPRGAIEGASEGVVVRFGGLILTAFALSRSSPIPGSATAGTDRTQSV